MDFSQLGSLMAVGAALGLIGRQLATAVFRRSPKSEATGWRRIWYRTMWLHPIIAGSLLALVAPSLPAPEFLGDGLAGRLIWYGALAGGWSHVIVRGVDGMFKSRGVQGPPPAG